MLLNRFDTDKYLALWCFGLFFAFGLVFGHRWLLFI